MPSVIPQGLFAPKADGIGIVDDFSNTPTAKILWRFLNLTHGTKGATKMKRLLTAGIFGTVLGIVGAGTANASIVSSGFLDEKLTEYALSTSLDLKANQTDLTALSNKIGDAWPYGSDISGGLYNLYWQLYPQEITLENASDLVRFLFGGKIESGINQGGVLNILGQSVVDTGAYDINTGQIDEGFRSLIQLTNGWTSTDGTTYLGVKDLNTKIGNLPSGDFPEFPGYEHLSYIGQPLTYPTSLAELITALYGNSETDARGLLSGIITGFPADTDGDGQFDSETGILSNFWLANDANYLANANATKIGTVPSGKNLAGMISETDAKIGVLPPDTTVTGMIGDLPLDTTVTGMMGSPVLLSREQTIIPLYELIFLGSNGQLVVNPISGATMPFPLLGLHDITAKVNKIGDLPTEYATVGAALTAIKGIAEDAKAAALAAIPDPKQEGSSGKFVLTVDIVGDNATYHWEKIDREGETTTTE